MIENPEKSFFPYSYKFSSPTCSRFAEFFEQISNEKTRLSNKKEIKTDKTEKKNESYKIEVEKIKAGQEKRTTVIIKGIPSSFGCMNMYNILKEFCKNINYFYIPGYIYKQKEFMYAFINVKYPKEVLSIYKCMNIFKEKFGKIFGCDLSGVNINYSKTQGYRSLKRKYTNEFLNDFLIYK